MALKLIQGKQITVNLTGSFTGSFSGSFNGTSSYATNALTASYLSGYVSPFPYTGSAQITGSLGITGSLNVTQGITGSLFGTSSRAVTASFAQTAPYSGLQGTVPTWNQSTTGNAATATTASFALTSSNISPAITNNVNNLILTATGTGTVNGEGNLTFDGTTLTATSGFAQGATVTASGGAAHAQGSETVASGDFSHAEGQTTVASGRFSHTEGLYTVASGSYQHVQGQYNISSSAQSAFIIGNGTAVGSRSNLVFASGSAFQVTGSLQVLGSITGSLFGTASRAVSSSYALNATSASDISPAITSNVNNYVLTATGTGIINGESSLTFDGGTLTAASAFKQGSNVVATGDFSHAEGMDTTASGSISHAEGYKTLTTGIGSHAEGHSTVASGSYSHAKGYRAISYGEYSHAEGNLTKALGSYSHTEGDGTETGNRYAFKATVNSGIFTIESGYGDITSIFTVGNALISDDTAYDNIYGKRLYIISAVDWSGTSTVITITDSSVSTTYSNIGDPYYIDQWAAKNGNQTISSQASHAEGNGTVTLGDWSHAEGKGTIALEDYQHVQGRFNIPLTTPFSFIHGNGTDDINRSNLIHAHDSTVEITGSLIVTNTITGNLTGTASYAIQALSASFATTSSYATIAGNGGVTQILAGTNVILSPTNGLGQVTINATGGNSGFNTATGSYGSFYNTGSVLATSATLIYSMSLSSTDISNGVFVSSSNGDTTKIKFTNTGVYNIQFSAQFSNSDNSIQDVVIWVKKNGTDIVDSSGVVGVPPFKAGSNGQALASWNYYLNLSANDYVQLCWHVEQANVITLETIAAGTSPTHPRTPSLILTAQRVDTFLSNTGSFSGSFTGNLIGSASYATTASYVLQAVSSSFATTASFALNAGGGGVSKGLVQAFSLGLQNIF